MKSLEAITTVYSYRFPEVRKIVSDLTNSFPHEIFLRSVEPPGALDDFHEPIIDKIVKFYADQVPELGSFNFRYPTSGSEEGIREVMTKLQTQGVRQIYVFKGEYEGYRAVAGTRGIEAVEVDLNLDPKKLTPGYWFLSNPSARDGNILPNYLVNDICEAGHQVFYDLAYLGSTKYNEFDLSHQNIFASVISFSKSYGLFYDRIGFTFSREAVPCLYGNKWFKSILGLMIADRVVSELKPGQLYDKYHTLQEKIVSSIRKDTGLPVRVSDALLLAWLPEEVKLDEAQKDSIRRFKRDTNYRFCLTPYFLKSEGGLEND